MKIRPYKQHFSDIIECECDKCLLIKRWNEDTYLKLAIKGDYLALGYLNKMRELLDKKE